MSSPDLLQGIGKYFYQSAQKLISANSFKLVGGQYAGIDIVRQVLKVLPVYWVATDLVSAL
jgi:linoleate 10R-lipoxygenase